MYHLSFKPCLANIDSWPRLGVKSDDTDDYYCALLHTDDALVAGKNEESIMRNEIGKNFELKEKLIRIPKTRFDGSFWKVVLENLAND